MYSRTIAHRLAIIALGLSVGCARLPIQEPPQHRRLQVQPTWERVSETEGIRRLAEKARTLDHEESYAFFPEHEDWYTTADAHTITDTPERFGRGLRTNWQSVFAHFDEHSACSGVVEFHYHPASVRRAIQPKIKEGIAQEFLNHNQIPPNISEAYVEKTVRLMNQMPSDTDVYGAITKTLVIAIRYPGKSAAFKVVGEEGTVSLELSPAGLEHYLSLHADQQSDEARAHADQVKKSIVLYATARDDREVSERLSELCSILSRALIYETSTTPKLVDDDATIWTFTAHTP